MLVFGPYRACLNARRPNRESVMYNFSSLTQLVPRLVYLFPAFDPSVPREQLEYQYYQYLAFNENAFVELMQIMFPLYEGKDVFICISTGDVNVMTSWMNELLMGYIKDRYGYMPVIINESEDIIAFNESDFRFSLQGILNMDSDRERYMQEMEEQRLKAGGRPYDQQ